jgi:DNA processing protein
VTLARGGDAYPAALLGLADPPAALHVRGILPERDRAVAIVGARAATPYGRRIAGTLAGDLARLGFAVVSGLARGIDAAAHLGALEAGGPSVAVLPGGLDAIVPVEHRGLAERLAERGALVSEWASGPPRFRGAFVTRNRIIAALSAATVVVEAGEASGALATAAAARALGRPVLAVPADVDRPTSRGTHALLRSGARLCEEAADVLAALAPLGAGAAGAEGRLLAALGVEPEPLERLAIGAGLGVDEALAALLRLEWAGAVERRPGQRFARAPRGT